MFYSFGRIHQTLRVTPALEAGIEKGIAISPWVDLSCSGSSFETNAPFEFVGKEHCLLAGAA